jgi:hypothetical protein
MRWIVGKLETRWLGRELSYSDKLELVVDLAEHFGAKP